MDISYSNNPGCTAARVDLTGGETCTTEGGAMIAMSGSMTVTTTTHKRGSGGLLAAAKRMLAGESIFLNHYTAPASGGHLYLASALPGDMTTLELTDKAIIASGQSFVCSEESVDVGVGWQGFKSFFSGERVFWVKLTGQGKAVVNSFGAIYPVEVEDDMIVDTGHIVAFEESLSFKISKAGKSWIGSFLGGGGNWRSQRWLNVSKTSIEKKLEML